MCVNSIVYPNTSNVPVTNNVVKPEKVVASQPQNFHAYQTAQIGFKGSDNRSNAVIRTKLVTKEEQEQFKFISQNLSRNEKRMLNELLKSGILLKNDSDNNSSVLDNLYSIATTDRAPGLDNNLIVKNLISTLAYPYSINQKLGDIPEENKAQVLSAVLEDKNLGIKTLQEAEALFTDLHSSTCPTACVEFNLASKHQAEYARFINDLTSPKVATDKIIELRSLSPNLSEAIQLLNMFKTPYEIVDANRVKVSLKPDKNAIIRAQIQTKHQNGLERNATNVLIQSTLMNLGSQQTYNALIDKRQGDFASEDTGLIEFEKTYVESVVENKCTTSMLYQQVDENLIVTGYESDFVTTKNQLLDTLKRGQNVIIGITYFEKDKDTPDASRPQNAIAGGHEITVVGAKTAKNGETIFICQDSDDEVMAPVEYPESWLLPRLHHAGLPEDIAERTMPKDLKENWQVTMNTYQELKKSA